MKRLFILFLSFLTLLSTAYSIPVYTNNVYNCINVTINVNSSLPINDSEYNLSNCIKEDMTLWNCKCDDIDFSPKINAINNYSISVVTNYYKPSSGHHKHKKKSNNIINQTVEINNTNIVETIKFKFKIDSTPKLNLSDDLDIGKLDNVNKSNDNELDSINKSTIVEEDSSDPNNKLLICVGILIILGIFIGVKIKF